MAILYALVARGSVVLAEFSGATTNASAVARQILERISGDQDTHVSYSQDRYIFHVKRTDGVTVLCVADDTAGSEVLGQQIDYYTNDPNADRMNRIKGEMSQVEYNI
ncbi:hypothetical protein BHM03_00043415 [Ensete ventricosum]|nr:hypothetical protein BHM03_00043415 [Ensete ventricosum]